MRHIDVLQRVCTSSKTQFVIREIDIFAQTHHPSFQKRRFLPTPDTRKKGPKTGKMSLRDGCNVLRLAPDPRRHWEKFRFSPNIYTFFPFSVSGETRVIQSERAWAFTSFVLKCRANYLVILKAGHLRFFEKIFKMKIFYPPSQFIPARPAILLLSCFHEEANTDLLRTGIKKWVPSWDRQEVTVPHSKEFLGQSENQSRLLPKVNFVAL